jgi:hypothetical protein
MLRKDELVSSIHGRIKKQMLPAKTHIFKEKYSPPGCCAFRLFILFLSRLEIFLKKSAFSFEDSKFWRRSVVCVQQKGWNHAEKI